MLNALIIVVAAVGVNVHLPPADTLDLAQDMGSEWVRIDFNWNIAEPTNNTYDWSVFDRVIDDANARGLKVFATIGYGAAWASVSGDRDGTGPTNDVPNAVEYKQFVTDAAARYADGRVAAWGTWNEPNLEHFFEGTKQEWIDNAFIPGVDGIKAGCPSCLILGPELATIGDKYEDYLRAALNARGDDLDAISWHIYHQFPEDDAGAGVTSDSFYNKLDDHRIVEVGDFVVYEGPLSAREVAVEMGYGSLPIWVTETGQQAASGQTADLEAQRLYIERVMNAMAARSFWTTTFFYELVEEHPMGMWPDIHWGIALRTSDSDNTFADNFELKPAYDWLKGYIANPPSSGGDAGPIGGDAGPGDGDAGTGDGGGGSGANGGGGGCAAHGAPGSGGLSLALVLGFGVAARRRRRRR